MFKVTIKELTPEYVKLEVETNPGQSFVKVMSVDTTLQMTPSEEKVANFAKEKGITI